MKTELQTNLLLCLQSKMSDEPNVKPDTLTTGKFKNRTVISYSDQISNKFKYSLENNNMTDIQILNRLCSFIRMSKKNKKNLLSSYDKKPEDCAKKIADLIYTGETYDLDCEEISPSIKNDITDEQTSCFYRELNEWVEQAGSDEKRIKAQELMIHAFENNDETINLNFLDLTTLPSAITHIKSLREVEIIGNKFSAFPECLYTFSTLEKIDIQGLDMTHMTAGMRMLISKFNCDIIVEKTSSGKATHLYKELSYFKDIFMDGNNDHVTFYAPDLDGESYIDIVNKDALTPQVEKTLSESYYKKTQPKTQDEFLESFDQCDFKNKRTFLTKDGSINVIGCSSSFCDPEDKSEHKNPLDFVYQNVDSLILLIPFSDNKEKLEQIKNCSGNNQYRLTQVKSLPIIDFAYPRLEHYEIILNNLKNSRSTTKNRPKTVMISCGAGEGRTGTCLAMLKLIDEFKLLSESDKKDINSFDRSHNVLQHNGTFTHLNHGVKTTAFIAGIIDSIRSNEEHNLTRAISVETEDQIATLELIHLMLVINHMQQDDPLMTDDEILKLIYSKGFSKDFILMFGDNYFTKPIEGVLTDADMLKASENKILQRIRNIHTII
ncbi:MAG: hypothetical protein QS721_07615 [Candidatus Endonucleobacter sp. (ex Gigantidas childressi)]|nr:hypothetical protein [Candidatus Endonucleobacter sp. (ex Gigantidas childressi)]